MNSSIDTDFGKMPSNWRVSTLGQIASMLTDGSHFSPREVKSEFFMVSVKDMRYNHFDFSNAKTISFSDYSELSRNNCIAQKGDILISKDGANCLDIIFVYRQSETPALLSSIAIVRLHEGFDPDFFRYFLLSPDAQYMMRNNFVSGSAIPRVVLKDFRNVPVPVPPIAQQNHIASVLSSLDDKIDLLHRQNKTLEEMAETLFRQWFVEEAEESWEARPLDQIAEFLNGLALQKLPKRDSEQGLPVIKIKELNQGVTENSDYCSEFIDPKYIVTDGDVLFSWSGSLELVLWSGGKGALNQHLFKVTSKMFPKWFIYFTIKRYLPEYREIAANKATTMGHIQRHHLTETLVKIPPNNLLSDARDTLAPLFEKVLSNRLQIKSLERKRDVLLPKLMSGEVTVS